VLRLPILEIGRRLIPHGSIDQVNDVVMLTMEEIASGLAGVEQLCRWWARGRSYFASQLNLSMPSPSPSRKAELKLINA
jgi:hypothetical protein